jgi:hypothetical protein
MKKLWLVVVLLFGVLTVSGCQTQLDETDQSVNKSIDLFLDNLVDNYVSETYVNDSILASIYHLDPKDKETYIRNHVDENMVLNRDNTSLLLNALVFESVLGKSLVTSKNILESKVTTNPYEAPTLLHAAYMTDLSQTKIDEYIQVIIDTDPEWMDADYAGMALLALSPYLDVAEVKAYIDQLIIYIISTLSAEGVVSWGNANSSSTATVIIGLLAIGENPRNEKYTVDGIDLIEALMTYEVNGAFKWMSSDTDVDMMFSTPQAFAALALYQIYRKEQKPIYLYDFSK